MINWKRQAVQVHYSNSFQDLASRIDQAHFNPGQLALPISVLSWSQTYFLLLWRNVCSETPAQSGGVFVFSKLGWLQHWPHEALPWVWRGEWGLGRGSGGSAGGSTLSWKVSSAVWTDTTVIAWVKILPWKQKGTWGCFSAAATRGPRLYQQESWRISQQ